MNDDPTIPAEHPDEQLAEYLDGAVTAAERSAVDAHLALCAACRQDLEFARAGRDAMGRLPELESPDIARTLRLPATGGAVIDLARRRRRIPGRAAAWAAGIAAALVLGAVVVGHSLNGSTPRSTSGAAAGTPSTGLAPVTAPPVTRSGADYTAQALATLARQLAASNQSLSLSPGPTGAPGPPPQGSGPEFAGKNSIQAANCVASGSGFSSPQDRLVFLQLARFEGTPAYIEGLVSSPGGKPYLFLVAVSRNGCHTLQTVAQAIGS